MEGSALAEVVFAIRGPDAWRGDTDEHVSSQVTQLVCMGLLLQDDGTAEPDLEHDDDDDDDLTVLARALDLPRPRKIGITAQSASLERLHALALHRSDPGAVSVFPEQAGSIDQESERQLQETHDLDRLWNNITVFQSARSTVTFLAIAMRSEHDRVRAMAAAVLRALRPRRDAEVESVLRACAESSDRYAREFVAMALSDSVADAAWDHERDSSLSEVYGRETVPPPDASDPGADEQGTDAVTSIAVHSTFARLGPAARKWFLPTSSLSRRIRTECTPSLYQGAHTFRWSAGYSAHERAAGANDLMAWCDLHGTRELDTVFAHSHGGSVVLDAISRGLRVRLLVLLHVPVIPRSVHTWRVIEQNTGRVLDLRTACDWVVLLDRMRTKSRNHLPQWLTNARRLSGPVTSKVRTSHTYFVRDKRWAQLRLTGEVAFERRMAGP